MDAGGRVADAATRDFEVGGEGAATTKGEKTAKEAARLKAKQEAEGRERIGGQATGEPDTNNPIPGETQNDELNQLERNKNLPKNRSIIGRTGDFFKGVGGRIAGGFKRIYKIIGNHYGKLIGLGLIVVFFIAGFSGDFDDKSDSTKTNSSTGSSTGSSTKSGTGSSTSTATQNSSTDDEDPDNDKQTSGYSGYIKYILIGLGVALVIGIIILSTSHKKAKPVTHSSAPGFSDNMSSYPQGMSDLDFMD